MDESGLPQHERCQIPSVLSAKILRPRLRISRYRALGREAPFPVDTLQPSVVSGDTGQCTPLEEEASMLVLRGYM